MKKQFPFFKLPGELRNRIYEEVANSSADVNLFKGCIVLPPLANTCRKVRKEMHGKYEVDVLSKPDVGVKAHVFNCNFEPLGKWLDAHASEFSQRVVVKSRSRKLDICMTLTSTEVPESSPHSKLRGDVMHRKMQAWQSEWYSHPTARYPQTMGGPNSQVLGPQTARWGKMTYHLCQRRHSDLNYSVSCSVRFVHNDHRRLNPSSGSEVANGFSYLGDFSLELMDKVHDDLQAMNYGRPVLLRGPTVSTPILEAISQAYKEQKDKKWDADFCNKLSWEDWKVVRFYRSLDVKAFEGRSNRLCASAKRMPSPSDDHYLSTKKRFLGSPTVMRLSIDDYSPGYEDEAMENIAEAMSKVSM
ncbi:hypothetical protein Q7P37_000756 [Cladosporium fusiforme]